jgi:hypothetical protein
MSHKTIAEFFIFVILVATASACGSSLSAPAPDPRSPYAPAAIIGRLQSNDIDEASGLAASPCQPDVFWTLNDSGGGPFIYAIRADGGSLGTWRVPGITNYDWEDIAAYKDPEGRCYLYIGEIGDNDRRHSVHAIYRIAEPKLATTTPRSDRQQPIEADAAETTRFTYPDELQNAETVLVHPFNGDIYVITKRMTGPARVYKVPQAWDADPQMAELVGQIAVPAVPIGLLTGGSISPDGRHVILSDYVAGYELTLPEGAAFDSIWSRSPVTVDIGKRETGEAVCYSSDGSSILATSEGEHAPIYRVKK